ncbi:MAG: hypothetical protein WCD53_29265 [Microcoleus sp.]
MRFAEKVWLDFVSKNRGAISWGMALLARAFGGKGDRPSEILPFFTFSGESILWLL